MISEVKTDLASGVLAITISRVDKKNALTNEMYGALADTIEAAETDGQTRVILIQADGDTFTSGNDVGEFAAQSTGIGPKERHVVRFLRSLIHATVPIVAAVQGKAVGVGTTMLLHCDYIVLAQDAQLITPFVNLALVPEAASSYLLPSRVGYARAFDMFALGEPLPAELAVTWGIANKAVPTGELRDEARKIAGRLALKPLGSLKATKQLMRDEEKLAAQMDRESATFVKRLASPEAREAFMAFAQKRQPDFSKIGAQ